MTYFKRSYLPTGDVLFKIYWTDMGKGRSIGRLCRWCKANGYVNPVTGNQPTLMAVWFRMYRWAIRPENQDEAQKIFNAAEKNDEPHFSYDIGNYNQYNFDQWIKSQAKTSLYGRPRVFKSIVKSLD